LPEGGSVHRQEGRIHLYVVGPKISDEHRARPGARIAKDAMETVAGGELPSVLFLALDS